MVCGMYIYTHSNKVCVFSISNSHNRVNLFNQLVFLIILKMHVPFSQPRLPRSVLDENEPYLQGEEDTHTKDTFPYAKTSAENPHHYL